MRSTRRLRCCVPRKPSITRPSGLINLLGHRKVRQVWSTIGCEQEFFLLDRQLASLRPDLKACGRTLFGSRPSKGQELDDHYFGAISQRALGFHAGPRDRALESSGVSGEDTTQRSGGASAIRVGSDLQAVDGVHRPEHGHDGAARVSWANATVSPRCLHEKPFQGVNGSGKHTNWSLEDDLGANLLEPGKHSARESAVHPVPHRHHSRRRLACGTAASDHRPRRKRSSSRRERGSSRHHLDLPRCAIGSRRGWTHRGSQPRRRTWAIPRSSSGSPPSSPRCRGI